MFSTEQDINRYNYRLRFQEMENKIKKCELERTQLEQKFGQLMQERQECEKTAARSLKLKYKRMKDLERQRAERNEELLRMLHKVDQQAASLAAKTDRLKMLKTQYESYLIRSWSSQRALPMSPTPFQHSPQLFHGASNDNLNLLPARCHDPPKSEFVKYLSDMTHLQTTENSPIPPPMALSNYISNQQAQAPYFPPTYQSAAGPSWSHPIPQASSYNPSFYNQSSEPEIPPTPQRIATIPPSTSRKLKLSNEEFIHYIDNEILKGPISTAPAESIVTPPCIVVDPPSVASAPHPTVAPYLEDVANDEDILPKRQDLYGSSALIEKLTEATAALTTVNDQRSEDDGTTACVVDSQPDVATTVEKYSENTVQYEATQSTSQEIIDGVDDRNEQPVRLEAIDSKLVENEDLYTSEEQPHLTESDLRHESEQNNLEYQQVYSPETDYLQQQQQQREQYFPEAADYQGYVEGGAQEYSAQEPADYQYSYEQAVVEEQASTVPNIPAENSNHWTTAREAVESKEYANMTAARFPESIVEVANNEEKISERVEKQSTSKESKRSSPEVIPEEELPEEAEQPVTEQLDSTQNENYSQYVQQYDQTAEQEAYQYQQEAPEHPYPMYEDQTGQMEPYQEYSADGAVDPNQYQQATEYPGPTQYVFEQDYYDQQQTENQQQYDPNQPIYYGTGAAAEEQQNYYTTEQQQELYDESQQPQEYEAVPSAYPGETIPEEPTSVLQEEEQNESKVDALPAEDEPVAIPINDEVQATEKEKHDTTVSSTNDESDFDFSTQ
ncbi:uncharacterized protein LOC131676748 isoform X2 [Topomyia yanbarensis]|uniref:uncharacterized protein LOC131676748 isoform X2 n=1 Tax=Topomyia yanbarensis TaxID=2498891 RepID=UPI00273BBE97|nr:uncharacterized protein LOC131676748 isoform X2 [Topomyia yanbarensis]